MLYKGEAAPKNILEEQLPFYFKFSTYFCFLLPFHL